MVETNWGKAKCMLSVKAVHSPDPDPSEANCCYISGLYAAFAFGFAFLNLEYRKTPSRARPVPAGKVRIYFRETNFKVNC